MPPGRRLLRTRSRAGIINPRGGLTLGLYSWLCVKTEEREVRPEGKDCGLPHTLTAFAGESDADGGKKCVPAPPVSFYGKKR
jgi:hypothetical protein